MRTEEVCVLVPARNEEQLVSASLDSIRIALHYAQAVLAGETDYPHSPCLPGTAGVALHAGVRLASHVVVVADHCTDRTSEVAAHWADQVVISSSGSPGAARALGLQHCLGAIGDDAWLMCTDADTVVPREWVMEHLTHRWAGADALAGTVTVSDWTGRPAELKARYERCYRQRADHVHGANLGFSRDAYLQVGGFAAMPTGEDQDLVDRLRRGGFRVDFCAAAPVDTSSRRQARSDAGFADYLNELEQAV